MIKVKIDGLQARDYISPTGDWNYEAIDALGKALCDKYREAETEQILEEFKKYTERTSMGLFEVDTTLFTTAYGNAKISYTTRVTPKGQQYFIDKFVKERGRNLMIPEAV